MQQCPFKYIYFSFVCLQDFTDTSGISTAVGTPMCMHWFCCYLPMLIKSTWLNWHNRYSVTLPLYKVSKCVYAPFLNLTNGLHLLENDGLLLPDGVNGVALGRLGLEGFPLGVHWEAEHVDLHVRADFLIRQELAWDDLLGRRENNGRKQEKYL